jgi:hypothetical protein
MTAAILKVRPSGSPGRVPEKGTALDRAQVVSIHRLPAARRRLFEV